MTDPADILRRYYAQQCSGPLFLEAASGGGINSQNWLVRLSEADAPASFVLKRESAGTSSKAEWDIRLNLHQQVAKLEPLIPPLIASDDGQQGIQDGEYLWHLLEFRQGKAFPKTPAAIESAAHGLAQLHKHIRSIPGSRSIPPLYEHLREEELKRVKLWLAGPDRNTPFGSDIKSFIVDQLPATISRIKSLEENSELSKGWVHRDFHPANALFVGDRLTAILDMDSLATDFRMQAVAFATSRFCQNRPQDFLAAYHSVDPLTDKELKHYPDFVQREALRRINWIIRVNVIKGENLWRGDLRKQMTILQGPIAS